LKKLAQQVADRLPTELVDEVVLTGSVSRGMADEVSDIEMLMVTDEALDLEDCFRLVRGVGLADLDTWGDQNGPTRRVSGHFEGVAFELVWWSHEHAEGQIDSLLAGEMHSTADALAHAAGLPKEQTSCAQPSLWTDGVIFAA
jgi:predicted nucleotidyltransferase